MEYETTEEETIEPETTNGELLEELQHVKRSLLDMSYDVAQIHNQQFHQSRKIRRFIGTVKICGLVFCTSIVVCRMIREL